MWVLILVLLFTTSHVLGFSVPSSVSSSVRWASPLSSYMLRGFSSELPQGPNVIVFLALQHFLVGDLR